MDELNNTENTVEKTEEEIPKKKSNGIPFKSGEEWTGNKNGRPKGSRNLTKIFDIAMHEVKERAKAKGVIIEDPEIEVILSLLGKAQKGDVRAMELYMKYKYGNPTQPIDLNANIKTEGIEEKLKFFESLIDVNKTE